MLAIVTVLFKYVSNPKHFAVLGSLFLLAELAINYFIINFVKYTEIDWIAYMQEVEGFLNGTWDYVELRGDTGPLVYPAGFVYIYSALYTVTGQGHNLRVAQYIFSIVYLINLALVIRIYQKTAKIPPYVLVFLSLLAYRVHSIFVLRMFNDPVATCLVYLSINLLLDHHWRLACICYSLAVSVKMNILLYAPGWLIIFVMSHGIYSSILHIIVYCGLPQVSLALPFLITNPVGYLLKAFEFQRKFLYKWTVNWRFLPEHLFLNETFHILLLAGHLACLWVFIYKRWTKQRGGVVKLLTGSTSLSVPSNSVMVSILFESNFIGIVFARTLHYQFYIWYFHTLPYLLWNTGIPLVVRFVMLIVMEGVWNVYPSTVLSSILLHVIHLLITIGLIFTPLKTSQHDLKQN
ncbi:dol-P-Man:Man(5)GlcNAc(2)-PP-Dol alpha-1,3-mannosyltransferase-like [Dysidea avara]|uniref:dol-P-Man:Man(5)GlcNAc(2)-PP-Dol alpha-1,3-mannosyltransferase-like n=1 Tax=Dysidea avara TaxID=196820 RepID=UPI003325DAF3